MNKMLLPLFFIISIACFSQDRISVQLPVISDPITVLDHARGWKYDFSTEQWNGRDNAIGIDDDFIKYEFRSVDYKNEKYISFLVYYNSGYWDYPEIQEGYHSYVGTKYFIIPELEYKTKISSITDSIGNIKIKVLAQGLLASNSAMKSEFASAINEAIKSDSKNLKYLLIQHRNIQSKNLVQYIIFGQECQFYDSRPGKKYKSEEEVDSSKYYYRYSFTHRLINDRIEKFTKKIGSEHIFDYFYYETKLDNFIDVFCLKDNQY